MEKINQNRIALHTSWGEIGWLSEADYYLFWSEKLIQKLGQFINNKNVIDLGAGNCRIWIKAIEQGLTLKKLTLLDPDLRAPSDLLAYDWINFFKGDILEHGESSAQVAFFKQSFHIIYSELGNSIFELLPDHVFLVLSMPAVPEWPISLNFLKLYKGREINIKSIMEKNNKSLIYNNKFSYKVKITLTEWIQLLEKRFVSTLKEIDENIIRHEIEWAKANLPANITFNDTLNCTIFK